MFSDPEKKFKPKRRGLPKKRRQFEYKCDQCDFSNCRYTSLKQHKEFAHKMSVYECEQCDYGCLSSATMVEHVEIVHMGKQYKCKQCEYAATEKGLLGKHMQIQHPCTECKQTSTPPASLEEDVENKLCKHWEYSTVYTGSLSLGHFASSKDLYIALKSNQLNFTRTLTN